VSLAKVGPSTALRHAALHLRACEKEPLDDLADLVSNLFSPILNRGQDPLPTIHDHPFGPNEMGVSVFSFLLGPISRLTFCMQTLVSVKTIMAFHAVEISFPLSFQPPLWKYKPANFLAHFVGHEGPGSLHSYLKQKGWCTTLNCGAQNLARGFAMFKNTIHLTQEGFRKSSHLVFPMINNV
jgi:insulysin